jgi:serine protease Do
MKALTVIAVVVAVAAIVAVGVTYTGMNGRVNDIQTQVASLRAELAKLQPGVSPSATSLTMVDLITAIQPVVARVDVVAPGFTASGTGVIIRADGYLVTNQHVIDGASTITVTLNSNQQYGATVASSDSNLDLAVIKLTGGPNNLSAAVLGAASDIVIGGSAVAAGFPLGGDLPGPASFTQGIVSAIRTLNGQRFVQTDTQINPGNSGGALVNRTNGKVIGITTAGIVPRGQDIEGIGLAVPIDVVQTYLQAHPLK